MASVAIWLQHAAEIWSDGRDGGGAGPTGRFAEVLRGYVADAGGNSYFDGTPDECVAWLHAHPRIGFAQLVPLEWREVKGEVAGADHLWRLAA